jgi:hypothetical protein
VVVADGRKNDEQKNKRRNKTEGRERMDGRKEGGTWERRRKNKEEEL